MDRMSMMIVLLVGFLMVVFTSAVVGGAAGFVAARVMAPFGMRPLMPFAYQSLPAPFRNPNPPNSGAPNQQPNPNSK